MTDWTSKYEAPEGQVWVCGACGRNGRNRATIGDESCFLKAVLCYEADPKEKAWVAVEPKEAAHAR